MIFLLGSPVIGVDVSRKCELKVACCYAYIVASSSISKENSIEVIHLDILRTFPTLCFFQEVIVNVLYAMFMDVVHIYYRVVPCIMSCMMCWVLMCATDQMSDM